MKFRWETEFKETDIGEIPKDWEESKIGIFYRLQYGITATSSEFGNCRLLRQTDLKEGMIDISSVPYSEVSEDKIQKYLLKEDDLVISRIANVGSIGYVSFETFNSFDKPLIFGSYLLKFEKIKEIHNKFIFYFLLSPQMQDYIKSTADGSTRQNTNAKVVAEFPLYVPPLSEQSRIATVLSWFDDLIGNKERQNEILEKTAMAIFKSWFIDFEPFRDEEFVYNEELGKEIPKGWEVKRLGEVVKTQYGITISGENLGEIKLLRITDINKTFVIDWDNVPYCNLDEKMLYKYNLSDKDVVISRIADIGKVAIIEDPPKSVFASYLIRLKIKSDSNITPYYLYYWLKSEIYQEYILGAGEGSTRENTNAEVIKDGPILIPDISILQKFEKLACDLRSKIILNQKQIMTLKKVRETFLPLLVFGKLRVEEI
jgi:type I restriction enzyme S subunit